MDINSLCDFLCLSHVRSLREAAEQQGITLSGLSKRVKSLEQFVGADLFDRTQRPMALTPAGEQFQSLAVDMLTYIKQAEDDTDLKFLSARFRKEVLPRLLSGKFNDFGAQPTASDQDGPVERSGDHVDQGYPLVQIEVFRSLTGSSKNDEIADVLSRALRKQLSQSVFFDVCEGSQTPEKAVSFRVEGTVVCSDASVHVTLHLASLESQNLLLSRRFNFERTDLENSLRESAWEFAWNISNEIRRYEFDKARKLHASQRTGFQNFLYAHDLVTTRPRLKQADVVSATDAMNLQGADEARILHIYGLSALRAWSQNPEKSDLQKRANTFFSRAVLHNEKFYLAMVGLASTRCFDRDFDYAEACIERASKLAPDVTIGLLGIGFVHVALGHYDHAIRLLNVAKKFERSGAIFGPPYIGLAYYLQGRYLEAASEIDPIRSPFPDAIAIKLAASAQARVNKPLSVLRAGYNLLPKKQKKFYLARFPLRCAQDRQHLLDGLNMAGVDNIVPVDEPRRTESPLDDIEFDPSADGWD